MIGLVVCKRRRTYGSIKEGKVMVVTITVSELFIIVLGELGGKTFAVNRKRTIVGE